MNLEQQVGPRQYRPVGIGEVVTHATTKERVVINDVTQRGRVFVRPVGGGKYQGCTPGDLGLVFR